MATMISTELSSSNGHTVFPSAWGGSNVCNVLSGVFYYTNNLNSEAGPLFQILMCLFKTIDLGLQFPLVTENTFFIAFVREYFNDKPFLMPCSNFHCLTNCKHSNHLLVCNYNHFSGDNYHSSI